MSSNLLPKKQNNWKIKKCNRYSCVPPGPAGNASPPEVVWPNFQSFAIIRLMRGTGGHLGSISVHGLKVLQERGGLRGHRGLGGPHPRPQAPPSPGKRRGGCEKNILGNDGHGFFRFKFVEIKKNWCKPILRCLPQGARRDGKAMQIKKTHNKALNQKPKNPIDHVKTTATNF